MRFLKLLDPYELVGDDVTAVGRQQQAAHRLFPELVAKSRLHYWRLGDPVTAGGMRLLIGLQASFNLSDLRLADIINDELQRGQRVHLDVFDVYDWAGDQELTEYIPGLESQYCPTPWLGIWQDGVHQATYIGHAAREFVLEAVGSALDADMATRNLSPPLRCYLEG